MEWRNAEVSQCKRRQLLRHLYLYHTDSWISLFVVGRRRQGKRGPRSLSLAVSQKLPLASRGPERTTVSEGTRPKIIAYPYLSREMLIFRLPKRAANREFPWRVPALNCRCQGRVLVRGS